eukprot:CAMPEP_0119109468 /NCGR_PEP_ID=MMETSP1180-20130426/17926_1 /TAXON_ID=3052 ORGANISM="Chlamydomonas cf sp, Strain CCMP681" /NCGR_SAMPLE_ID=MMETSP1180 /ASSEMBLY_ACC=CAM_ASM_000741 /LENGTH=283 /DNA_ID=CAMNT_0007095225 /DNA_START=54 /DNA_END=905 /DNA_ORIENTATION=-
MAGDLLDLLAARAERKDTRVFAQASSETQVAITHGSRPGTTNGATSGQITNHLTASTQEPGFLEVFPRGRPPRLLQELESMLLDRLRSADKAAWPTQLLPKDRDSVLAANLALEVHRQVFATFAQSFSTYTPILLRIQAEFELALAEGVRCAWENVEVRQRLAEEAVRQETTKQEIRAKIMAEEAAFRVEAYVKLQETRERTVRLSRRAMAAERELAGAREEQTRMNTLVATLRATQSALKQGAKVDELWTSASTSESLQSLLLGPLNPEDQAQLEQEEAELT